MIGGIILTGGQGKRAGFRDKGLVNYQGKRLIDIKVFQLAKICSTVYVVGKQLHGYADVKDVELVEDKYDVYWPVIGIYSGLLASRFENNFITAVDMPNFDEELFNRLSKVNGEIVLPRSDRIQVLWGFYKKTILDRLHLWIDRQLGLGKCPKILEMFSLFNVKLIDVDKWEIFDNINYL